MIYFIKDTYSSLKTINLKK